MARKRVYLIRHGQTKGNTEKRYIGQKTDEPLSDKGRAEAERLRRRRDRVFAIRPDRVLSSPMKRAVDTAAILFDDMTPAQIDELTEMDFGRFEGKNYQQLSGDALYQTWIDEGGKGQIPLGESFDGFCKRSLSGFWKALGEKDRAETIAIVCHGGTIMAIMSYLTEKEYFTFLAENLGGYNLEVEWSDEGSSLISYSRLLPGDPA